MTRLTRAEAAARLRDLHRQDGLLVLPNAWDAASAKALAALGHPAIATTSHGVDEALGFEDGGHAPADEVLAAVRRIVAAVDVPVTADMEDGYGLDPAAFAAALAETGAVGCNIEDTDHATGELRDPERHAEWLAALRAADPDLVINARIDVYLRGGTTDDGLLRARRYAEAGADCVYPIFVQGEERISRWVGEAGAPVNVLLLPDGPPPPRLAELGVRRATFGAGLFELALQAVTSHPWAADTRRYSPASPLKAP